MRVLHVQDADFAGLAGDTLDELDGILTRGTTRAEDLYLAFGTHNYHLHSEIMCVPPEELVAGLWEHK